MIGKIGRKEVISFKASGGSHTIETRLTGLKFGSEPGSRLVSISGEEVKYFEISFGGFTSLDALLMGMILKEQIMELLLRTS